MISTTKVPHATANDSQVPFAEMQENNAGSDIPFLEYAAGICLSDVPGCSLDACLHFNRFHPAVERLLDWDNYYRQQDTTTFNCHQFAQYIVFGHPLDQEITVPEKPVSSSQVFDPSRIEEVIEHFFLPCGVQLWKGDRFIHDAVFCGKASCWPPTNEFYIYHKMGWHDLEIQEMSQAFHYYPDYDKMIFYGDKLPSL